MALPPSLTKHNFEGIGKASATLTFALLAASPTGLWFTQGIQGKLTYIILTKFYGMLASFGLVVLNIGVSNAQIIAAKNEFDASFDSAFKILQESAAPLSPAQQKTVDDAVIAAFRKFATFGVLDHRDSKPASRNHTPR